MKSLNKLGKIRFDPDLDGKEELCEVFSLLKFVPYKAEYDYANSYIEAIGISPLFKELEKGLIAPLYGITVETVDGKITGVSVGDA